ncbi:MAG: DNA translocase FtsK [Clostridia bacterium]|nr:DNA translocase FtsK [Clostridia bacterium]
MAQKRKTTAKKTRTKSVKAAKRTTVKQQGDNTAVIRIIQFVIGLIALFLLFCYIFPAASGAVGLGIRTGLFGVFGVSAVLLPILLLLLAVFLKRIIDKNRLLFCILWGLISQFFLSVFCGVFSLEKSAALTAADLFDKSKGFHGGGVVGGYLAQLMRSGLGAVFTGILSMLMFLIFFCLTIGITPSAIASYIERKVKAGAEAQSKLLDEHKRKAAAKKAAAEEEEIKIDYYEDHTADQPKKQTKKANDFDLENDDPAPKKRVKKAYDFDSEDDGLTPKKRDALDELLDSEDEGVDEFVRKPAEIFLEDGILVDRPVKETAKKKNPDEDKLDTVKEVVGTNADDLAPSDEKQPPKEKPQPVYKFPPMKLLSPPDAKGAGISNEEANSNARKIVDTLANFGISVSVDNISRGPTITRYELRPAPGVRIAKIGNLIDDLARVLASGGVRFEGSIEGKDTVGIEVPNKVPFTVNIRSLLDTDIFRAAKSKVFCALGVDVSNSPTFLDIQKMPHMIIAGATGMGKSVCINSLIVSILYRARPDEVKLIMIDPKKVEFAPYIGIPHLLVPVITDMKKAAGALNWLVQEMERRYDLIEAAGCRNIFSYNEAAKDKEEMEKLPLLVIIIDELADLMATSKDNVESSIARIAAKARAAGMHLIIGTQRPDVTIISGTIKNNIPSRIACRVGSQIDSRTILDEGGAERLIGRGDMLYKPVGALKLTRLQGAFVSEAEVESVVNFIKNQGIETNYSDEAIKNIDKEAENINTGKKKLALPGAESGDDELLLSAIEISFDAGKVATSLLNRKLSIGYGRAAKIIDRMEEMGICSGANGSKPRELIMSREQFEAKYGSEEQE